MKIYITKKAHYQYNYLANWQNPENGAMIGEWFYTLEDIKDYMSGWAAEIVKVNF